MAFVTTTRSGLRALSYCPQGVGLAQAASGSPPHFTSRPAAKVPAVERTVEVVRE